MEIYDERIIIMRRQIESLQGAVQFFQQKHQEEVERVLRLEQNLQQVTTQLQAVVQHVALLRAMSMGTGPTVR